MPTLNDYMRSVYRDGGRGEVVRGRRQFDCWGMSIAIRHELLGLPLLPAWSFVRAMDKRHLTRAWSDQRSALEQCEPEVGALAAVYRSDLCLHIAVVVEIDGGLAVVETRPQGPRWMRLRAFEQQYTRVRYYRDRDLSQQA